MKRTIDLIVIHTSASPDNKDFHVADIDAWHKVRGFKRSSQYVRMFNPTLKSVGYHFVIPRNGVIETGRHIEEVGAHVAGFNSRSIGICLVGNGDYAPEQYEALKRLLVELTSKIYGKPTASIKTALSILKLINITVCGHRDLSPDKDGDGEVEKHEWVKTCPNFSVREWLHAIRTESEVKP